MSRTGSTAPAGRPSRLRDDQGLRVWVDLDNAPHAPFFRPIVGALREMGCSVVLTARAGQAAQLAHRHGLEAAVVGGWRGSSVGTKVVATAVRAAQLAGLRRLRDVDVAVSHGSRPMLLAAALRRIPAVTMYDYEGVSDGLFRRFSRTLLVPALMPPPPVPAHGRTRLVRYPGLKEEVYLADFQPQSGTREALGVGREDVLVVVRPESDTAHYRAQPDSAILDSVLDRLAGVEDVCVVLLPRTVDQERRIGAALASRGVRTIVPEPMDGRDLVWAADLVVSGGGTMTREAAVLGVPAYSMFRGTIGAVDRHLADSGRLVLVRSAEDAARIRVERSSAGDARRIPSGSGLPRLLAEEICSTADAARRT